MWVWLKPEARAVARQVQIETEAPVGAAVWYLPQTVSDCSSPDVILRWLEAFLEILGINTIYWALWRTAG